MPRVMRPIKPGALSTVAAWDDTRGSAQTGPACRTATAYSTSSNRTPGALPCPHQVTPHFLLHPVPNVAETAGRMTDGKVGHPASKEWSFSHDGKIAAKNPVVHLRSTRRLALCHFPHAPGLRCHGAACAFWRPADLSARWRCRSERQCDRFGCPAGIPAGIRARPN